MGRAEDLTGKRFYRLVALEPEMRRGKNNDKDIPPERYWKCQCDCGNTTYVTTELLKSGKTKSCGCYNRERTSQTSLKDLTGRKIGRLTVIERAENIKGKVAWRCLCDCGNETVVKADSLNNKTTKSCGCLLEEQKKKFVNDFTKHNKRHTRIYGIYCDMKKRCYNNKSVGYKYYGAKGIRLCDEWLNDFMAFYDWSMEHGYTNNLTIDRIDPDGNYEPSNCQWITRSENIRRRNYDYWEKRRKEKKEEYKQLTLWEVLGYESCL